MIKSKYPAKTVVGVSRVEVFTATFSNARGEGTTRLFMLDDKQNMFFLHPEGVDDKLRQPAGWLKDELLGRLGKGQAPTAEIPVDSLMMELSDAAKA